MKKVYELKIRGILGDEAGDDKEIVILNRTLAWTEEGLEYRADDKHVSEITKYFGLNEDSKGLSTAMVKEPVEEEADTVEDLPTPQVKEYRALAAWANYLSLDRPDIQVAMEICRDMCRGPRRQACRR